MLESLDHWATSQNPTTHRSQSSANARARLPRHHERIVSRTFLRQIVPPLVQSHIGREVRLAASTCINAPASQNRSSRREFFVVSQSLKMTGARLLSGKTPCQYRLSCAASSSRSDGVTLDVGFNPRNVRQWFPRRVATPESASQKAFAVIYPTLIQPDETMEKRGIGGCRFAFPSILQASLRRRGMLARTRVG